MFSDEEARPRRQDVRCAAEEEGKGAEECRDDGMTAGRQIMTCEYAIQALREGKIVRRASWQRGTFISPMMPGGRHRGQPERMACLRVPGSISYGWYPTEDDRLAEDWEIVPFSAANCAIGPISARREISGWAITLGC
jgi:hypothetical protein